MKLLVTSVPLAGHVHPMIEVVRALVARGHEVHWIAAKEFGPAITATGAKFDASTVAIEPVRGGVKKQLRGMFIDPAPAQLAELADHRADAILADSAHLGAALYAETRKVPWVGLGISALMVPSIDTAPFGSGLPPERVPAPWLRKFLNWIVFKVAFGDINRAYRRMRSTAGLPAGSKTYFDVMAPDLFLQPTVPSFEYPRSDLPPQVKFIGPLIAQGRDERPAWWTDVTSSPVPVVLVTQGTLADDPRELIEPTLRALADESVLVIATTPSAIAGPANARIARFVPYAALLPHTAVMVTNGGYGGVQMALAQGVPMVVAGGSEEKPEIAARVAWAGAGIDLRKKKPREKKIRAAVRAILDDPRFRTRAAAIAEEMKPYDAPMRAVELIEQAVRT